MSDDKKKKKQPKVKLKKRPKPSKMETKITNLSIEKPTTTNSK